MNEDLQAIKDRVSWTKQVVVVAEQLTNLCDYTDGIASIVEQLTIEMIKLEKRVQKLEETPPYLSGYIEGADKRIGEVERESVADGGRIEELTKRVTRAEKVKVGTVRITKLEARITQLEDRCRKVDELQGEAMEAGDGE